MAAHTAVFHVTGMTCHHCTNAVTEEVSALEGVSAVEIDLESGKVSITADNVSDEQIIAAIDEAGYPATRINE